MAVAKQPYVPGTYALEMIDSYFESASSLMETESPSTLAHRRYLLRILEAEVAEQPTHAGAPAGAESSTPESEEEDKGYDAGWHAAHRGGEQHPNPNMSPAWQKGYQHGYADGGTMGKLNAIPQDSRSPEQAQQAHGLAMQVLGRHHNDIMSQVSRTQAHQTAASLAGADPRQPFHEPLHDWGTRVRKGPSGHTDLELNLRNFMKGSQHPNFKPSDLKRHLRAGAVLNLRSWAQNKQRTGSHEVSGHATEPDRQGALDVATKSHSGGEGGVPEAHLERLHHAMSSAVSRMPHPEGWQPGQRSAREFLARHIIHGMDQSAALQDMGLAPDTSTPEGKKQWGSHRQWASDQAQRLMRDPELLKVAREVHGMRSEATDFLNHMVGLFLESGAKWSSDDNACQMFINWLRQLTRK